MRRLVVSFVIASGLAFLTWACSGGGSGSNTSTTPSAPTPPAATVAAIQVVGLAPLVGSSAQFAASATMSSGSVQAVTSQATWVTSNASVATVTNTGVVAGIAAGPVDIMATYQNVSGTAHVTIVSPTPATIAITGTVTDGTSGGVLPGISVAAAGQTTATNAAGTYTLANISPGNITVTASAVGYQTLSQSVLTTANARVDFVLQRVSSPPSPTPTPNPTPIPTPTPGSSICTVSSPIAASCGTATAICNDRSLSCSQNRSGTCSSHGGVSCFICPGPLCQ